MSLAGTTTTLSSKAWTSLYDLAANRTADLVTTLIEMGAIIVGKTKVSQFSAGQQWTDELAPWTPRSDGYQNLFGSSAGACAALAGYPWLHQVVGQDGMDCSDASERHC